jgi:hypothetical protein
MAIGERPFVGGTAIAPSGYPRVGLGSFACLRARAGLTDLVINRE